jgi:hypothetical protein
MTVRLSAAPVALARPQFAPVDSVAVSLMPAPRPPPPTPPHLRRCTAADIEIYMKIYWKFNDLKEAIKDSQIELHDPEGEVDSKQLTDELAGAGIEDGALVYCGLPRRKHGSGEAAPPRFNADMPVNIMRPFANQLGKIEHITPCWTAYDRAKQVLSCQVHLALRLKVPNPDLASYPIDRRVVGLEVQRKKNKESGIADAKTGKKVTCKTEFISKRPLWVKFSYPEDDSVLTVKWPDNSSSRKLPLDLRQHKTALEEKVKRDKKGKKVEGEVNGDKLKEMELTGAKQDQGVFVYKSHLIVLMERNPSNFLWNVVLPNWILIFAAHSTMFMEFYQESGEAEDNNKALLAEQIGVGLGVILAVMANKFVALQQELPQVTQPNHACARLHVERHACH